MTIPKAIVMAAALLSGAILVVASALHAQDNSKQQPQAAPPEQAQPQPNPPLPVTVTGTVRVGREKEVEPDWNNLKCDQAKSHDEADLCEQRRMAKAAERTVDLNWLQVIVGTAGFVGLLWNLYYVRQSTKAAINAATAAQGSVAITADTAKRQLRAYVSNVATTLEGFAFGQQPKTAVTVQNDGQTPAHGLTVKLALAIMTEPATDFEVNVVGPLSKSHLAPGAQITPSHKLGVHLDQLNIEAVRAGTKTLYVFGEIDYLDIFNEAHKTRFRFLLKPENAGYTNPVVSVCPEGNEAT